MTPEEQAYFNEFELPKGIRTKFKRLVVRMQAMSEELDRGPKRSAEPRRQRLMKKFRALGEQISNLTFDMIASTLGLTPEQFRLSDGKELARLNDRFQAIVNELAALEESGVADVFDIGDMIAAAENGKAVADMTDDETAQQLLQEYCDLRQQCKELSRDIMNRAVAKAQNKRVVPASGSGLET